jgi:hypothetical protein
MALAGAVRGSLAILAGRERREHRRHGIGSLGSWGSLSRLAGLLAAAFGNDRFWQLGWQRSRFAIKGEAEMYVAQFSSARSTRVIESFEPVNYR